MYRALTRRPPDAHTDHSPTTVPSRLADQPPESLKVKHASTGIPGLDAILGGGLPRDRLYLIDGQPGSGKTTAALHFLLAGVAAGERVLYVTLSETADELRMVAESHGWSLSGVEIVELAGPGGDDAGETYTLFHPAEVELQQTVDTVLEAVERHRPARVALDSLSEMRLLARDPLRFRRQILALKQFFTGRECTVLLLDDRTGPEGDHQLASLAHGVLSLERIAMEYGAERRRLEIGKLRGSSYRGGYHDFRIRTGGVEVYPRVVRPGPATPPLVEQLSTGSSELDALLGGGIPRGTSALIAGAAGTGKSVLSLQFARAAVERGEHTRVYLFDERIATAQLRAEGLEIDVSAPLADGRLVLRQIEPTEMSSGEFINDVARSVEEDGTRLIVLDSLNGLLQAMPDERLLTVQVHELLSFLSSRGVTMIMTLVRPGVFGTPVDESIEVSFLADALILLRYFEHSGTVRHAISVVKKRSGTHERTIREYRIGPGGLLVGQPLEGFRGVLTGVPTLDGGTEPRRARGNRTGSAPSP